jgi:hypothetical protein
MGCTGSVVSKREGKYVYDVTDISISEKKSIDAITDITFFQKVILTDSLFQHICGFLNDKDPKNLISIYLGLGSSFHKNNNYINVNNLLNVSRSFRVIKKENFYFKLNKKYSLEYYHNKAFKAILSTLLANTRTQLSINLSRKNSAIGYLLNSTWRIKIIDVSGLHDLHTLNLSNCGRIRDINALSNTHTLYLSGCCNIRDVSGLHNVNILSLSGCQNITRIDGLINVHTLDLSRCRNINIVSSLRNIHTLDLRYCSKTIDISALGNVDALYIFR